MAPYAPLPLAFLGMPGGAEWIVILIVALLLFGRRLPEVMRSMGRGVVEFKKGIKGIEDDVEVETTTRPRSKIQPPAEASATAEKDES
jgi:sec-independent protein translocase protein TatA